MNRDRPPQNNPARSATRNGRERWKISDGEWIPLLVRVFRRLPRRLVGFEASEIMGARTTDLRLLRRVPTAFTVRSAEPADEPRLERFFKESTRTPRRLSSEDACLLAIAEGEIRAVEWVRWGPSEYGEDERRLRIGFRIPAAGCWLHNGGNASREMVGPWGMVMGRLRPLLEKRGVETIFLQVAADNVYSVTCHESLGFRRLGRLAALRLLNAYFVGFCPEGGTWVRLSAGKFDLGKLAVQPVSGPSDE